MADLVIDLSHWNGEPDFAAVKASGVVGVIHKATESDNYTDPTYFDRRDAALKAGLLWGAYHFLRPGNMGAQADYFVATVSPDDIENTLLAADHEDAGVSLHDLREFLAEVEAQTGQKAVIYSGNVIKEQLGDNHDAALAQHRLWLAHYTDTPTWPTATWPTWWLWQHTDAGAVPGISGNVDLNDYHSDALTLSLEWAENGAPSAPPAQDVVQINIAITVTGPPGMKVVAEVRDG